MRSLVFGATGYTGQHVVAELARRHYSVVAHLRPASNAGASEAKFASLGASLVRANWDAAGIERLVATAQPDVVFGLIGTTRKRAAREGLEAADIYEHVDRALTALAIECVVKHAPGAHFVYLSAVGVTDGTSNPYLRARARVEAQLKESGLKFTIARPSFITGPDREESRPLERGVSSALDAGLRLLASLGAKRAYDQYATLTGAELGAALVEAATHKSCEGLTIGVAELKRLAAESRSAAAAPARA